MYEHVYIYIDSGIQLRQLQNENAVTVIIYILYSQETMSLERAPIQLCHKRLSPYLYKQRRQKVKPHINLYIELVRGRVLANSQTLYFACVRALV